MNGTKTKDAKEEEKITSPNSIAENIANDIANEVKKVLDSHAPEGETIEVKKYKSGYEKIIDADTYEFSIFPSGYGIQHNFGWLNVAIYRDNRIWVGVSFNYGDMPLRDKYMRVTFGPNRTTYPYLALRNLVRNLGDTIKEMNVFKTAKIGQIDIDTYDPISGDPVWGGSYHYERHKNNKTGIRQ